MTIDQFNILFDIRNDMAGLIASESERVLRAHQINVQRESRTEAMLGGWREQQRSEQVLRSAVTEMEMGFTHNAHLAVLGPTPEQVAKGGFGIRPVAVDGGTTNSRTVTGYRRREQITFQTLWRDGKLRDEAYAACMWFRRWYEFAQLEPSAKVSSYEPVIPSGNKFYAHLPMNEGGAEARRIIRSALLTLPREPSFAKKIFILIAVHDYSLSDADRLAKCRKGLSKIILVKCANMLYQAKSEQIDVPKICGA